MCICSSVGVCLNANVFMLVEMCEDAHMQWETYKYYMCVYVCFYVCKSLSSVWRY